MLVEAPYVAYMPGSLADDMGILQGDIILTINRQPVKDFDDVRLVCAWDAIASVSTQTKLADRLMVRTSL